MRSLLVLYLVTGCGRIGFDELGAGDDTSLGLTPAAPVINVGAHVEFTVTGGTPPYTLRLDGQGSLTNFLFTAPSQTGTSTVTAVDAGGLSATADITYKGTQLILAGGDIGGPIGSTVFGSLDGATWTQIGNLPDPRANGTLVAYDDALFYLGGIDSASNPTDSVFKSLDGKQWMQVGTIPVRNTGFTSTVHAGEIWFVGGATQNGNSGTAYHSRDGVNWIEAPAKIAVVRHEHDLISRDGTLYVLGGHGDIDFLDDIVSTVDGTAWTTAPTRLTFAADFPAAGMLGDVAFRVCGTGCNQTETSSDMVTWTPAANLPGGGRESPAVVGFDGRLLVIGGSTAILATTDGSSWTAIGTLPQNVQRTAAVPFTPK